MDIDSAFESIKGNIKDGKNELVLPQVREIVDAHIGNPEVLIKCASLLKVVEEEDYGGMGMHRPGVTAELNSQSAG